VTLPRSPRVRSLGADARLGSAPPAARVRLRFELGLVADVVGGVAANGGGFGLRDRSANSSGIPHDQRPWGNVRPLDDQRAGGHDRAGTDDGAVQNDRAHPDQTPVLHDAPVENRGVAYRHLIPNQRRMGVALHMHDAAILDIRTRPNPDPIHVPSDHDVHPDTALVADLDIADDLRAVVYKRRRSDSRGACTVGPEHLGELYVERAWPRAETVDTRGIMASMGVQDRLGRPLANLRLSVTDRCNLRCQYCMPERDYVWLPRADILTFEEIETLVDVFTSLGTTKVRLTGGEPLLRKDLPDLLQLLSRKSALTDLALTTNGILLADQVSDLRAAGLPRITVSLDTLQPDRFQALTRFDSLPAVLRGLGAAAAAGFDSLKVDTVVIRGVNDDELVPMLEYGRGLGAEVRFIEYMDVGGATRWSMADVVSRQEMLKRLSAHYGTVTPVDEDTAAPADRFTLPDGTVFGIISSTTEPFCRQCDRSRLTADGVWYRCLYAHAGTDLREPLRAGAGAEGLRSLISTTWAARDDRGAEDRLASDDRSALIPIETLQNQPHLEMHTRGG
jgi:cyclic pyranopterin phosphate synthase